MYFIVYAFLDITHHSLSLQDEESIPMELRNLPEYKELLQLKQLKKKTLQDIREDKIRVQHIGYKVKKNMGANFTLTLLAF